MIAIETKLQQTSSSQSCPVYRLSDPASLVRLTICLLACTLQSSATAQQPANSKAVLQESFDRSEPGDQWTILTGQWKLADGALIGMAPNGKSSAVICCKAATGNAAYQFNFMFSDKTDSLEFGFNQPSDDTTKVDSQFSLKITPQAWFLLQDTGETTLQGSTKSVVAKQNKTFAPNRWYGARITTWGPYVTAKIDNRSTLTASAKAFANRKSAIVFRSNGGPVEIDDIQIWTQL